MSMLTLQSIIFLVKSTGRPRWPRGQRLIRLTAAWSSEGTPWAAKQDRRVMETAFGSSVPDTHQSPKGMAGALDLEPLSIKTLLERAGLRTVASSMGASVSGGGVWNSWTLTSERLVRGGAQDWSRAQHARK